RSRQGCQKEEVAKVLRTTLARSGSDPVAPVCFCLVGVDDARWQRDGSGERSNYGCLIAAVTEHRIDVRRERFREGNGPGFVLRHEPAMFKQLVEHLGRLELALEIARNRLDDRFEDSRHPLVRDHFLIEVTLALGCG